MPLVLGPVDILVNNAGIGLFKASVDLSEDEWDSMIDTNLKGPFLCAQAVVPDDRRRWGRIINITSTGSIRVVRGMGAYCASKAGLAMLTQALAAELGRHGITVNGVGPSTVPTDINRSRAGRAGHAGGRATGQPQRAGSVPWHDIAAAVAFLASDAASWINGQNLIVDGGLTVLSAQPAYKVQPSGTST